MFNKFFDNIEKASAKSEIAAFFLLISGIITCLFGVFILGMIVVYLFGAVGLFLMFPILALIRILYAGIFGS